MSHLGHLAVVVSDPLFLCVFLALLNVAATIGLVARSHTGYTVCMRAQARTYANPFVSNPVVSMMLASFALAGTCVVFVPGTC